MFLQKDAYRFLVIRATDLIFSILPARLCKFPRIVAYLYSILLQEMSSMNQSTYFDSEVVVVSMKAPTDTVSCCSLLNKRNLFKYGILNRESCHIIANFSPYKYWRLYRRCMSHKAISWRKRRKKTPQGTIVLTGSNYEQYVGFLI